MSKVKVYHREGENISLGYVLKGERAGPPKGAEIYRDGFVVDYIIPDTTGTVSSFMSPVEFKLLFTSSERVAIKQSTDPIVQDFFEIVEDLRLTRIDLGLQSTIEGVDYLENVGLIAEGRAAEILSS